MPSDTVETLSTEDLANRYSSEDFSVLGAALILGNAIRCQGLESFLPT